MKKYLKLMRVHHYLKNALIFTPLIFSGNLFNLNLLSKCLFGFFAFSMAASAIYILNDIKDVESDKHHEIKKNRPLASGAVSPSQAYILLAFVIAVSIILNYFAESSSIFPTIFLIIYIGVNIMYSMGLKNIPLVDVAILVSGFLIRVLYGSAITGIEVSNWLYLTIISMSFYLGLGKRRNEIIKQAKQTRKVLKFYTHNFLDKNMYMCLALTITFYSLWCVDAATIARYQSSNIVWTVPLVMLICMKYSLNVEGDSNGDPVDVILSDKTLMALIAIYAATTFCMIYMR